MGAIRPGLCSVTLRALPAEDVVAVVSDAGLECVEWGGDVHVPPGDRAQAERVAALTLQAGVATTSYGSYFRAGVSPHAEFDDVLVSARVLGASRIRIWAGGRGSASATPAERRSVVEATRRAADAAAEFEIGLGYEFHGNTLTDDIDSALRLLAEVDRDNVYSYWQPPIAMSTVDAVQTLRRLGDRVPAVHVFSWWPRAERLALAERESLWREVLDVLARTPHPVDALMEFVADDDPANVIKDAAVLRRLV